MPLFHVLWMTIYPIEFIRESRARLRAWFIYPTHFLGGLFTEIEA